MSKKGSVEHDISPPDVPYDRAAWSDVQAILNGAPDNDGKLVTETSPGTSSVPCMPEVFISERTYKGRGPDIDVSVMDMVRTWDLLRLIIDGPAPQPRRIASPSFPQPSGVRLEYLSENKKLHRILGLRGLQIYTTQIEDWLESTKGAKAAKALYDYAPRGIKLGTVAIWKSVAECYLESPADSPDFTQLEPVRITSSRRRPRRK